MPVCNLCEQEKPASEFYTRQSRCKECAKAKARERYHDPKNTEAIKAYAREYARELREAARNNEPPPRRRQPKQPKQPKQPRQRVYRDKRYRDDPEYRERQKLRTQWRYRTNRTYFVKQRVRTRLMSALQQSANRETKHFVELVGCTPDHLAAWIESKFQPGMTWDNHNQWHIDHIIPLTSFDLLDRTQLRQAFHYTNMQPLWAEVNTQKGNRVVSEDELAAIIRDVVGDDA